MVSCRVDGGDTVDTSWETLGNIGSQNTVVRSSIETLEEVEDLGVQGLGCVERRHLLHGNVAMTLNDTADQLLRGRVVSVGRVRERSGDQVDDLDGNSERGVGRDGIEVLGTVELGGRLSVTCQINSWKSRTGPYHLINRRDITDGDGVARTRLDLQTVGNCLADAEVDEVVPG